VSACGSSAAPAGDRIDGNTLTIYSSAPLEGVSAVDAQAVVHGEQLALSQYHNRVGRYRIAFLSLDDATPRQGGWDPGQTTANARLAAANPTTIGYLGELDSGASAISIPVLNRAGIPQISAGSTAVGLTTAAAGAAPGEPLKYYPTRVRTFVRVTPNDAVQAVAEVRLQQSAGCTKTFVLDDGEVDGSDAANNFQLAASSYHLQVVGLQGFDPHAPDYTSLAAGVAQTAADCLLISAVPQSNVALLTQQLAAALPGAQLFATAGLADSSYTDPARGGIPLWLDPRVTMIAAALAPRDYPAAGSAFFAAYERRFGAPQPDAIFGYEAMSLLLSAIARATRHGTRPADRSKVLRALFSTRNRASVLGTYGIDPNGDTTLRRFGVYGVADGRLRFLHAATA
jgi:branched-chain amino acid transport system substrate-binding protein